MSIKGRFLIMLNDNKDKILLVKRTDYLMWDLPGGGLKKEESIENCAIHEALEETGYIIRIEEKVGEYDRTKFNNVQYVFRAKMIDGSKNKTGEESREVKWLDKRGK